MKKSRDEIIIPLRIAKPLSVCVKPLMAPKCDYLLVPTPPGIA